VRRSVLVTLVFVAACFGPQQDPSAYFLLSPTAGAATGASVPVVLGLGPVTIPGYLDRPQVVVRLSENEISLAEADRWAEPLEGHITQTLQENLSRQLPGSSYVDYPWYESDSPDYAVTLEVRQFESDSVGMVVLDATWRLLQDGEVIDSRDTRLDTSAAGPTRGAAVAAQSRALGELSGEIAAAVRQAWSRR
jgi:uncharacterized lipoprotein YmbA